jgi:hypothetical protein
MCSSPVHKELVMVLSVILDVVENDIETYMDFYRNKLNQWISEDEDEKMRKMVDDTRLVFDVNSRFETIGLIKAVSCVLNNRELSDGFAKKDIVISCMNYVLTMCKFENMGIDPNITLDSPFMRIGIYLAHSPHCTMVRRHFIDWYI